MTEDSSPLVRLGAAFALGQLRCSRSIDILTQRLASEYDPDIRQQIVLSLGQVGDIKTLSLLDEHFHVLIPDETLFKAYVYFFSRGINQSECIGFCCESLSSKNANNRRMSAAALQRIRNSELVAPYTKLLIDAAKNPDPEIRRAVAKVLRPIPFSKKDQIYSDLLNDPDWRVRYESVLAIPGLQDGKSLWLEALDDSSKHVVAAALQNAPDDIVLNQHLINKLTQLFNNSSEHIRGSIVQFTAPFLDSSNQAPADSFPVNETLLPYKIAGLKNSPNRRSFNSLLNLSKHRQKTIATPAYLGIINMLDSLIVTNTITISEYRSVLIDGLTGDDPVQVYRAADKISETDLDMTDMAPFLYECLKKHNKYAFLEACVAVLSAIEKITPDDAVDYLKPLLSSKQKQIRDKSRHILTEIYGENV
ncbi:MAG: HEAT repeat domain-containing protein, partial [Candidatus Marinimicrobia bacterium]|nr:HEAT repeat domain-containing protein [Candidatus Neomarinimicrobiota bacterium]